MREEEEMGRLEDTAIAKMRARMSRANLGELLDILKEIKSKCKGGNEYVDFTESLTRDVYAYAVVIFFNMFGFSVFGGFVSSHVSGKPWNDIDFQLPGDKNDMNYITRLIGFLRFAFGLSPMQITLEDTSKQFYCCGTYKLSITDDIDTHAISMDFAVMSSVPVYCPVTIGRCLLMKNNVISLRNIPIAAMILVPWQVEDIISILRDGKDVGIGCKDLYKNKLYGEYFWSRLTKIREQGIVVEKILGKKPRQLPPSIPPTQSES